MARSGAYSRLVRALKFILPLVALGILGTMFLFSRQIDPGQAIPLAGVDIGRILQQQGVGEARFVSSTPGGGTVRVNTRRATVSDTEMQAQEMTATVALPGGTEVEFGADITDYLASDRLVRFLGDVHVGAYPDLRIETEELRATNDFTRIDSPGPVRAEAAIGTITAGSMSVTLDLSGTGGGNLVVFQDGVRLIYRPSE